MMPPRYVASGLASMPMQIGNTELVILAPRHAQLAQALGDRLLPVESVWAPWPLHVMDSDNLLRGLPADGAATVDRLGALRTEA